MSPYLSLLGGDEMWIKGPDPKANAASRSVARFWETFRLWRITCSAIWVIMTPHVMKRDGCKVPFKSERIKEAILRAAKAAGVDDADCCATVAEVVSQQMQGRAQVDINDIQTAVENRLMSGRGSNWRAYIEYRRSISA